MTTVHRPLRFTAEAFIDWAMAQPSGRFELSNGEVVAMAAERVGHARVKYAAFNALAAAIAAHGLRCEVIGDGVAVRIDDSTVYEPDAFVRCGPRTPDDTILLDDPMIVVEVLSPSSLGVDAGAKLAGYFRLSSVRHYVMIDPAARIVTHHSRDEAGAIAMRILDDGVIALDPPGLEIAVADLFATL
jgi:Uma2 family endonuclease